MKKLTVLGALVCAAAFTSCSVNNDIDDTNEPVRFTAGIHQAATPAGGAPITKAVDTAWGNDDAIGIFMVQEGTTTIVRNAENKQYKTTGTGTFTPVTTGDAMYYPQLGKVGFIAYYPYKDGATLTTPIDVTIGTTQTDANQPGFDLLYSSGATGSKATAATPVALKFKHKLAKIVMNCKADASINASLDNMTVTIRNMYTKNTFNLSDGTLGGTPETQSAITARALSGGAPEGFEVSYDAIIMPHSYADGAVTVDFKIGTETFTWKLTAANAVFEGGNEYTYAVTITRRGVEVTGEIEVWDTLNNDRGGVEAD